jgi:hypothetical protein
VERSLNVTNPVELMVTPTTLSTTSCEAMAVEKYITEICIIILASSEKKAYHNRFNVSTHIDILLDKANCARDEVYSHSIQDRE